MNRKTIHIKVRSSEIGWVVSWCT